MPRLSGTAMNDNNASAAMASRVACLAGAQANASAPLLTFVDDERGCGLGCRFLRLTAAFVAALDARAVLALSPASNWYYAGDCAEAHACYFEPITPRESAVALSLGARKHAHADQWEAPGPVEGSSAVFTRASLDRFWAHYRVRRGRTADHACLAGVADPCEQSAAAAAYLLRPNAALRARAAAAAPPPGPPFLAAHVRHGDKARERAPGAPEVGLAAVVDAAARRFPTVRDVWLMTEDPAVVRDAASFPNFTFRYTDFNRTNKAEHGLSPGDARRLAANSLANLVVASEAAGFVGADDSTWFRLALLFAWGATGRKPNVALLGPSRFWTKGGLGSCFRLPDACPPGDGPCAPGG